jgi:chaperone required for assembly of F1-ATPase
MRVDRMADEGNGFAAGFFVGAQERNPLRAASQPGEKRGPRRFYREVTTAPASGGFAVLLDKKGARTPAGGALVAPSEALAEAAALEWAAQDEWLDPAAMPLTRLMNSALDGVALRLAEVEADVVRYAASDLICYRAGAPEALARAEAEAWDPLARFARDKCGAKLAFVEGIVFRPQPEAAVAALAAAIRDYVGAGAGAPFRLTALHAMTTLSGSCVIALAAAIEEIAADTAFAAAQVDEDYQMRVWGADAEALARRERRRVEMRAAAQMAVLTGAR